MTKVDEMSQELKLCGEFVKSFIAREGSFFPCALEKGHEGAHQMGGTCFRHGAYVGDNCPHWPTCATAPIPLQPPQTIAQLERTNDALLGALKSMIETHEFRGQNAHCLCPLHQQARAAIAEAGPTCATAPIPLQPPQTIAQLERTNAALLEALVEAQRLLHLCEFTHEADIAGAERIDAAIAEAESLEKKEL